MSNILRIYDFELIHKSKKDNVTFYDFYLDKSELNERNDLKAVDSEIIKWAIVLDTFRLHLTSDLNTEKLLNKQNNKIISRGFEVTQDSKIKRKDIKKSDKELILYSVLHGGKITDNSILEKITSNKENPEYENLNGDRIYDGMFFLIHLSFRCNKARLFVLTRKNNQSLDNVLKSYFEKNLFDHKDYHKSKFHPFVPKEIQTEALKRTVINNIIISTNENLNSESFNDEFEIEVKLKSKNKKGFGNITGAMVDKLKKAKLKIDGKEIDSDGQVKFNISDPTTGTRKSIVFGNTDDFIPKLSLEDSEILNSNSLDEEKLKSICLAYIHYESNALV